MDNANASTVWRLGRGRGLDCGENRIAGIINVTPDSFSDGGRHADTAAAVAHGLRLAAEGADILDVGGESTRPGATPVSLEEELRRVVPVVTGLVRELPDAVVSVDTYKAACAAAACEAGAGIVNDISACALEPELTDVLVTYRPGYVLMHSQGCPRTMQNDPRYGDDVVADILAFFETQLSRLVRAGLPEAHIVLDPGIGFGKRPEHNLAILRGLDRFGALGRPVYIGLSNKSFFGACLDVPVGERGPVTAVASALCAARGARIHRVHDVSGVARALRLAAAMAA